MPNVLRLRVYPIKSLTGVDVDSVSIPDEGRIEYDREFAMFSNDGTYVNGRQNELVHQIDTSFDLSSNSVRFEIRENDRTFTCQLDRVHETPELEAWLTDFFDEPISVKRAMQSNFTDSAGGITPMRINATGPTIVGNETLSQVASRYGDLTADEVFRRLRTNIVVGDVEPFWEDLFRKGNISIPSGRVTSRCG